MHFLVTLLNAFSWRAFFRFPAFFPVNSWFARVCTILSARPQCWFSRAILVQILKRRQFTNVFGWLIIISWCSPESYTSALVLIYKSALIWSPGAARGGKRKAGTDFQSGSLKRRNMDGWGTQPIAQRPLRKFAQDLYGGMGYDGNEGAWFEDSYGQNWGWES